MNKGDSIARYSRIFQIGVFAGCIILLHFLSVKLFFSEMLNEEFQHLLHSAGFFCMAMILSWRFSKGNFVPVRSIRSHALVFILLILLGIAAELIQSCFGRNASALDLLRDMGGILAALLFVASWKMKVDPGRKSYRLVFMACVVTLAFVTPFLIAGSVVLLRNGSAPILFTFERLWEQKLYKTEKGTVLSIVKTPDSWTSNESRQAAKVLLSSGDYPGVEFTEIYPDWSRHQTLCISIFSNMEKPILLHLRIHDRLHNHRYQDRFNASLRVTPGANDFYIPIRSIQNGPRNRKMDIREIESMIIFAGKRFIPSTIYMDNIFLK